MDIFGMSGLWIAAVGFAILAFILIAIAVTTVVINRHRPTVAEAVAAEERLARRQEELRDIDSKIHEAKARLTEADKKASEVALLEERVSNLKAEIETLEPRRAEILEVQTELERLTSELGDQLREVEKAKAEKDGLQRQIEHGQHLKAEMETLEKRVAELRGELEDLQNNRDDAEQARRELKTLGRELEELQEKKGSCQLVILGQNTWVSVRVGFRKEVHNGSQLLSFVLHFSGVSIFFRAREQGY
jgi:DNA repair exonuclease SbcCD ATPase subunit